ncbi:MAG TPA: hypothetical protein VGM28_01295, partial [Candidatus Limnocylindrales bacterium]
MTTRRSRSVAPLMSLVAIVLVVAGCTAGGPIASVSPASSPTAAPTDPDPTLVPGGPVASAPGSVGGAEPAPSSPDDPVSGGGAGVVIPPVPGDAQSTIVTPGVGLTGVHPVGATKLETAINGRDLAVRIDWFSGVEPCSVLAGV